MKKLSMIAVLAVASIFLVIPVVTASEKKSDDYTTLCERAYSARMAVIKKHGKRAPGRNICRYGVKTKRGVKDATTKQKAKYLRALNRLKSPAPAYLSRTAVRPGQAPAGTLSASVAPGSALAAIGQCESGGNPSAKSPDGRYRGKYQFSYSTWQSMGGSGDPAAAPETEQDMRAARLLATGGPGHWPVCRRAAGL